MKTYIYTYDRKKNDVNGNPRHFATVYRIKKNVPSMVIYNLDIGYMSTEQAIIKELCRVGEIPKKYAGLRQWDMKEKGYELYQV